MTQGNYVSDNTDNLIRRAQQTMDSVPVLDLRNWQEPRYMSGDVQIRSLAGPCHRIVIRNTVNGITSNCPIPIDASLIICTGTDPLTQCAAVTDCPIGNTVDSTKYINMIATFTAGSIQPNVTVTFKYLLNDLPTQAVVTIATVVGTNTVYAFAVNQSYHADTTISLYGAEVMT